MVTAARAEYGLLKPLILRLKECVEWKTQLIVTGAHLVEKFGYTCQEVEQDGIEIFEKIPINIEVNSEKIRKHCINLWKGRGIRWEI